MTDYSTSRPGWELVPEQGQLCLRHRENPRRTLIADWNSAAIRKRVDSGRRHPLFRATGLDRRNEVTVLDATAGLGTDAYLLASLGARVTAIEQDKGLFHLLSSAWKSAGGPQRLQLRCGDAVKYMRDPGNPRTEVVYLDPMYPDADRSSASRNDLQLLRDYLIPADNAAALLDAALNFANWRVIVKRPHRASPIGARAPDATVGSKLLRLDLYQVRP